MVSDATAKLSHKDKQLSRTKSQVNKKGYVPLLPTDEEIRNIVTSNGYGENKCCRRTNCFLEKLSIHQAVILVKRYVVLIHVLVVVTIR